MKECVYGWYPPANNVWKTRRDEPDSYTLECLYRHSDSRFANRPSPMTPTASLRRDQTVDDDDRLPPSPTDDVQPQTVDLAGGQADADFPPPGHRRQTSRSTTKLWADRLPETPCSFQQSSSTSVVATILPRQRSGQRLAHRGRSDLHAADAADDVKAGCSDRQPTTADVTSGSVVARHVTDDVEQTSLPAAPTTHFKPSAVVGRCRSADSRDVSGGGTRTADGRRSVKSAAVFRRLPDPDTARENVRWRFRYTPAPATTVARPVQETVGVDNPLSYDEQLKKHGWKMEIPGDPLNLKKPCIPRRRPTSVVCSIPKVAPFESTTHAASSETFFYTTIHHEPMSFVVDPDWASESIVARRIELQKRNAGRPPYRHTSFGFVY